MLALLMAGLVGQVQEWDLQTSFTHVRSMCPSADGIWCATSGGAFFYDYDQGFTEWLSYPADLPHYEVYDVLEDSGGRLWVGTADGAAVRTEGTWTFFTEFEGIPGQKVYDIEEAGGWIWAGSDGGLARWTGGGDFVHLDGSTTGGGFTASEVTSIEEFADSLWLATDQGVYSLDLSASPFSASSWQLCSGTQDIDISGLYASDSLFGYGINGVFRRDPLRWTTLLDYSASPDSVVQGLLDTPDGLLAACYGVKIRSGGTTWQNWGSGFPQYTWATCLAEGDGMVWCGAGNQDRTLGDFGRGLARASGGDWTLVPIPGMPGSSCFQICPQGDDLYLGSHHCGLMVSYPSGWQQFDQSDGMPNILRTYSAVPAQGRGIWTAVYHYGLTWIDDSGTPDPSDDSLVTFAAESLSGVPPGFPQTIVPLLNNQVVCLARQGDCLWIGQESYWQTPDEPSGLVAAVGSPATGTVGWEQYTNLTGLASKDVRSLFASPDGNLWIAYAGEAGCQRLDFGGTPLDPSDDQWYPAKGVGYGTGSGLPSNQVFCFAALGDGSVAIGTGSGLCTMSASGAVHAVAGIDGTVKAMVLDSSGRLWCLGTSSIWCVDGSTVTVYESSNSPFLPVTRVENEYGLWDPADGAVFFSSEAGLWRLGVSGGVFGGTSPVYYPQPFLPSADGLVNLAGVSGGPVSVRIFSLEGRFLMEIDSDAVQDWSWDGTAGGSTVASGVYMTLVRIGSSSWACRMAVVR